MCICDNPKITLKNNHYLKRNIELFLLYDKEGYGIAIIENNLGIAVFDINFCPVCGKKLEV
jgi:hypothetical protein